MSAGYIPSPPGGHEPEREEELSPLPAMEAHLKAAGLPASLLEATYAAGYRDAVESRQIAPELYLRISLDKNTKGYNSQSTISVRGLGLTVEEVRSQVKTLLRAADEEIREETARREKLDQEYKTGPVGRLELSGGSSSGK